MKKFLIIAAIFISYGSSITGQLTINDCYLKARQNYPLIKRYALIDKTEQYNISNAGKAYLPQFSFNGKASYQSQVTKIPVEMPNFKGMQKDQYSATIDMNQYIWDGGIMRGQKKMAKAAAESEKKQLEVELYKIRDRVNQLFFSIILLNDQIQQNLILQEELQRNYELITNYMSNGLANQTDIDAVNVELIKAKQNNVQLRSNKTAYIQMLEAMIGEKINENVTLQKPEVLVRPIADQIHRPEMELFYTQKKLYETQKQNLKSANMPKLSIFMTGGYGRPGLNMLNSDFSPYYIGGVRISWNIGSLYTNKNDRRKIEVSQQGIEAQQETFLYNTTLQTIQENNEILKYEDILKYDDEIIKLRENIKKSTEIKLVNGTKTVTDLMDDVNSQDMARQQKLLHQTQLSLAIYNLKNTTNN